MSNKISEQVKDTAKSLDERMKKYRIYKEIAKDFLLMMPLLGSVGSTVLNWIFGAYAKYQEAARVAVEKAGRRTSEAVDAVANSPVADPSMSTGDFIQYFFIFWLVIILCWRASVKIKAKLKNND